ncbi:g922 [Coccomyxa viridis]|uniref:G922 protein n=1 Tax=Coccomyxa viridis TaxID=1274662 RepID=A0ABP1FGU5_9CHLO
MDESELRKRITQIHLDPSLTDQEKAKKRQELLSGQWAKPAATNEPEASTGAPSKKAGTNDAPKETIFDESLKCTMCMDLCSRPITAPCQHNFCLGCFNRWVGQGKKTCPTCRHAFPAKFAANPRINTLLASAIRMAKLGDRPAAKFVMKVSDKDRPDEAFTTDRAVRAGRANAASGRIMVTIPGDHFGPIPPEADPRGQGVKVGEFWKDRLDCRQWGAHFPHVAGIAGQSGQGAQSVVLSGGYEDDKDEGEWFLYTGSGGRDLSGNKRVSKVQSFDQTFDKMNKALLLSCEKGLPVRVVRSHKEKRSAYAPGEEQPVRYDGIYRIVRAYRKPGAQKQLVCRYLFIRCDNEPAPWSSEDTGDKPWDEEVPEPVLKEIKEAKGKVHSIGPNPWWDYDAEKQEWGWTRPAPISQRSGGDPSSSPKKARRKASEQERALREFTCSLCKLILNDPMSTPCGHHFCKPCLKKRFAASSAVPERPVATGRAMRERKVMKPCPTCKADIADFLAHGQINRGMVDVIGKLQEAARLGAEAAERLERGEGAAQAEDEEAEAGDEEAEAEADTATEAETEVDVEAAEESAAAAEVDANGAHDAAPAAAVAAASQRQPAPASAAAPAATNGASAASAEEMAALCTDFPEYDEELLKGMLEDQAGDVPELRAVLRRMRNQQKAAERKAKREAEGGTTPAKKKGGKKRAAPTPPAADDEDEDEDDIEQEHQETEAGPSTAEAADDDGDVIVVDEDDDDDANDDDEEEDDDFAPPKPARAKPQKRARRT